MSGIHVSLFAGIGGLDIAAEAHGFKTAVTVEIDPYCRKVLERRFPGAAHLSDVLDIKGIALDAMERHIAAPARSSGAPLLLSGGFPCQGVSNTGARHGLADARSGLWGEYARLIGALQPEYVLIENVAVLRSRGMSTVMWDLCRLGYNARWDCIPAAAVGAPHLRDRIFIAATREDQQRVGGTTSECDPVTHVSRFSRAGKMVDGLISEEPPRSSLSEAKKNLRALEGRGGCIWPTPRAAANEWRTTRNAPSHGVSHGKTLAGEVNDRERATGRTPARPSESSGNLNPAWVEWLMGFPYNWTDDRAPEPRSLHGDWQSTPDPILMPLTIDNAYERRARLRALGNAVVPQAANYALTHLLDRRHG